MREGGGEGEREEGRGREGGLGGAREGRARQARGESSHGMPGQLQRICAGDPPLHESGHSS